MWEPWGKWQPEDVGCVCRPDAKEMRKRMRVRVLKTMSSHTFSMPKEVDKNTRSRKKKRGVAARSLIDVCAVGCCCCCLRRAKRIGVLKFRLKISIWADGDSGSWPLINPCPNIYMFRIECLGPKWKSTK